MTIEKTYNKSNILSKLLIIIITILLIICVLWWIKELIKDSQLQNDPMLFKIKRIMEPLHPDIKHLKLYKGQKSYTINKEKIYICLLDENGDYYPLNHLIYVFLHEFAHYLNKDDVGHTEKFHEIFQDLLDKSNNMGIYDASIPPVDNYCGY